MLLAIDTSTRTAGVAVYDGNQVLHETTWVSRDFHTVELAPVVEEALRKSGLGGDAVEAIGVATGPGSFTGLRIGLAFAKGLALAQHVPLVGIPTLDIVAAGQAFFEGPLLAVLHAGRGRLAVGRFEYGETGWRSGGDPAIMTIENLAEQIRKPTRIAGELTGEERRLLARKRKNVSLASPAEALRRPGFLAELAWARWQAGQIDDPVSLSPRYLHIGEPIPG
jgi:tRNA threonylcarbamoyladenosine biosynthesis protein TsaB